MSFSSSLGSSSLSNTLSSRITWQVEHASEPSHAPSSSTSCLCAASKRLRGGGDARRKRSAESEVVAGQQRAQAGVARTASLTAYRSTAVLEHPSCDAANGFLPRGSARLRRVSSMRRGSCNIASSMRPTCLMPVWTSTSTLSPSPSTNVTWMVCPVPSGPAPPCSAGREANEPKQRPMRAATVCCCSCCCGAAAARAAAEAAWHARSHHATRSARAQHCRRAEDDAERSIGARATRSTGCRRSRCAPRPPAAAARLVFGSLPA